MSSRGPRPPRSLLPCSLLPRSLLCRGLLHRGLLHRGLLHRGLLHSSLLCCGIVLLVLVGGCGEDASPRGPIDDYPDEELAAEVLEEETPPDPDAPPPPAIADEGSPTRSRDVRDRRPAPVEPAVHADTEYGTDAPVVARRYVYGVRMAVPGGLGDGGEGVTVPAAELYVDVSHERLRARFVGRGWPVPAGSEVRLRRDRPGVYVFDGVGGRPLAPRELASWFEGGEVTRRGPPLRVLPTWGLPQRRRQPEPDDEEEPGELVCALLAEWSAEPWENVMRRCERGAPHLFRIGFWRGEQTAGVPVDLVRSAMRADEQRPPAQIPDEPSRAFLEPEALSRLPPSRATAEPSEDAPAEGLRVRNQSATRAIVTVDGIAIGWVDAGAEGWFVGLRPGTHEVGAIRPLGAVVQRGRLVLVPGTHSICDGRCGRRPPEALVTP